jgi:GMP synthase (glutamine-hydrolysing)
MPRALLIALRDADDPMIAHERACFARRAELDLSALDVHAMPDGVPSRMQLASYDAIFFGGSGAYSVFDDVTWIHDSRALLLEACGLDVPTWASCFGFQSLALALGGRVVHDASRMELGATCMQLTPAGKADPLFSTLPDHFWVQQGHHDHVTDLPESVGLLATGEVVHPQAFRVPGTNVWASQFHPELTADDVAMRLRFYGQNYDVSDDAIAKLSGPKDSAASEIAVGAMLARMVRRAF